MSSPHTHVVILAAGRGSRLGTLSAESPKWLLDVGGELLADRQLEAIKRADGAVESVRVVTGHAAGVLDRFLEERGERGIETVFNPEYAALNNWYSVLFALREIEDPEARVIIVNCDMFAEAGDMAAFFEACATTDEEALIAVDLERTLTDESMKVETRPDGSLDRIGKVGMERPVGEYVGMLMARGSELASFRRELEAFEGDPAAVNEWYEGAVGRAAAKGARWTIWPMPSGNWVEIDDDADLAAAVELVRATR